MATYIDFSDEIDAQVREYWDWLAAALFLFTTVDMITTVYAAHAVGVAGELNPLMQWTLMQGPIALVGVNLTAVVSVAVMFDGVIETFQRVSRPYSRYAAATIEAWLGGLLGAGLLVFANNLSVIVHGQSLL